MNATTPTDHRDNVDTRNAIRTLMDAQQEALRLARQTGKDCSGTREDFLALAEDYNADGTPRILSAYCADLGASGRSAGTVTLTRRNTFHQMSQYPGADLIIECEPQTVELTTNGYYAFYAFTGTVVGGGHYFRPNQHGEPAQYHAQMYAYQVDRVLADGQDPDGLIIYDVPPTQA